MRKEKLLALALSAAMVVTATACSKEETTQETAAAASTGCQNQQETTSPVQSDEESGPRPEDPRFFEPYDETLTMTISRRITVEGEQRLREHDGWSYEDNAVINWYAERLNIKFIDKFEAKDGEDYYRQVSLAMASEELPDVMQVYGRDVLNELVENDMIEDLTDVYRDYASNAIRDVYDSYGEAGLGPAMIDGRLMAIPGVLYGTQNSSLIWIRQDWLDKLGITIDEDGDKIISRGELEMVAREFVDKDPGGTGNPVGIANSTYVAGDTNRAIFSSFHSYPEKWLRAEDGTVYNGSTAPETKEALAYMHELYKEGLLDPQFGTRTYDDTVALAGNGQLGIFIDIWAVGANIFMNAFELGDKDVSLSCFVLGDENGEANAPLSDTLNGYIVVRKGYEHPEAVMKIVNLIKDSGYGAKNSDPNFESTEYYNMIVEGKETTCLRPFTIYWEGNDDLELKMYQPVLDYLDGKLTEDEFPIPTTNREILSAYTDYKEAEGDKQTMDAAVWQNYYKWFAGVGCLNKVKTSDSWKWQDCIFTAPTETMLEVSADLSKLTEEVFVKIIVGDMSVDEFDMYVNDWNDMGGAACCEELAEALME